MFFVVLGLYFSFLSLLSRSSFLHTRQKDSKQKAPRSPPSVQYLDWVCLHPLSLHASFSLLTVLTRCAYTQSDHTQTHTVAILTHKPLFALLNFTRSLFSIQVTKLEALSPLFGFFLFFVYSPLPFAPSPPPPTPLLLLTYFFLSSLCFHPGVVTLAWNAAAQVHTVLADERARDG